MELNKKEKSRAQKIAEARRQPRQSVVRGVSPEPAV